MGGASCSLAIIDPPVGIDAIVPFDSRFRNEFPRSSIGSSACRESHGKLGGDYARLVKPALEDVTYLGGRRHSSIVDLLIRHAFHVRNIGSTHFLEHDLGHSRFPIRNELDVADGRVNSKRAFLAFVIDYEARTGSVFARSPASEHITGLGRVRDLNVLVINVVLGGTLNALGESAAIQFVLDTVRLQHEFDFDNRVGLGGVNVDLGALVVFGEVVAIFHGPIFHLLARPIHERSCRNLDHSIGSANNAILDKILEEALSVKGVEDLVGKICRIRVHENHLEPLAGVALIYDQLQGLGGGSSEIPFIALSQKLSRSQGLRLHCRASALGNELGLDDVDIPPVLHHDVLHGVGDVSCSRPVSNDGHIILDGSINIELFAIFGEPASKVVTRLGGNRNLAENFALLDFDGAIFVAVLVLDSNIARRCDKLSIEQKVLAWHRGESVGLPFAVLAFEPAHKFVIARYPLNVERTTGVFAARNVCPKHDTGFSRNDLVVVHVGNGQGFSFVIEIVNVAVIFRPSSNVDGSRCSVLRIAARDGRFGISKNVFST